MTDLIQFVIEKHRGAQLWADARTLSAAVHVDGGFWAFKGQPDLLGASRSPPTSTASGP
jgi:hypothetical protein